MKFDIEKAESRIGIMQEEQAVLIDNLKHADGDVAVAMVADSLRRNLHGIDLIKDMIVDEKKRQAENRLEYLQVWRDQVSVKHQQLRNQLPKTEWHDQHVFREKQFYALDELMNAIDGEIALLKP